MDTAVPLSHWAVNEISRIHDYGGIFFLTAFAVLAALVASMDILGAAHRIRRFWLVGMIAGAIAIPFVVWHAGVAVVNWSTRTEYAAILKSNREDYERSRQLALLFKRYRAASPTSLEELGIPYSDSLRPFVVERHLSEAARGELHGQFEGHISFFSGRISGTIQGPVQGYSVPDLADASVLLLLRNERDDTLRVLLPSPRATRELLARGVETWLGAQESGTHTATVLKRFTLSDTFVDELSHPEVVDRLAASIDGRSLAERPPIRVWGVPIQPGVVLATALAVADSRPRVFFPSTFIRDFSKDGATVLGEAAPIPAHQSAVN